MDAQCLPVCVSKSEQLLKQGRYESVERSSSFKGSLSALNNVKLKKVNAAFFVNCKRRQPDTSASYVLSS